MPAGFLFVALLVGALLALPGSGIPAAPAAPDRGGPASVASGARPTDADEVTGRPAFGLSARDAEAMAQVERRLGLSPGIVGVYGDWTEPFPLHAVRPGTVLMVSWEPWDSELGGADQPAYAPRVIASGTFDDYIRSWARDAATVPGPVLVRLAPEMNGDWLPWSVGRAGTTPADYVAAWRRVVALARPLAPNIRWVFNPVVAWAGGAYPLSSHPMAPLWPGDDVVDLVALDGYNWNRWGWQSFDDIFSLGLSELRRLAPDHPLIIAEIGCAPGRGKADWVADALTRADEVGARAVVWFEHLKETDWRITGDRRAVRAAREALAGWATAGSPRLGRLLEP